MRTALGIAIMLAGAAAGIYFGLWWAFIGGIVDVIREVRADDMNATSLAFGIAKVIFAGVIGWLSALVGIVPGYVIASTGIVAGARR